MLPPHRNVRSQALHFFIPTSLICGNKVPMSVRNAHFIDWQTLPSPKGSLSIVEGEKLPFQIRRAYYLHGLTSDARRGSHAHRILEQVMICVHGGFSIELDDGFDKARFRLEDPGRGLYVPPMLWRDLYNFTEGCVCLVLASLPFVETEYIRDYDEFRSLARALSPSSSD
jgi:hypothetical protein